MTAESRQIEATAAAGAARPRGVRPLWYIIAVSQRYLQRVPGALATIARLEQLPFGYYQRGSALKKRDLRFKIEPTERNAQAGVCTHEFFQARRGFGCASRDPIFIVGLPCAGSTLLEQILASHSQVEGTTELPNILRFVADLQGRDPEVGEPRYPKIFERLAAEDFKRLGEKYIADTRV